MATQSSYQDLSQNRQGELRATMIVVTSLAALFVAVRFYARGTKGVRYGWDDWMILFALPWLLCLMALGLLMIHFGLGTHQAGLSVDQLVGFGKTLLAFECVYILTAAIIKTSLLLMYVRAFADMRTIRIASVVLEAIVIAWAIAIIALCIFQCTPVSKAWNPTLPGHCIDLRGSFIGNAVPNIVTDVLILILPIHALWNPSSGITLWLRLQLSFVFLLGSFVVFTAIYRFTTLFSFDQRDTTWTLATSCAWVVVEVASGVISVCLPTLGSLLQCGSWRQRSKAARSGSAMNSGDKVGSLPTQVYAMSDMEARGNDGFERLGSGMKDEIIIPPAPEAPAVKEIHFMDGRVWKPEEVYRRPSQVSGRITPRGESSERDSDTEAWVSAGGLAPPPRSSMMRRP